MIIENADDPFDFEEVVCGHRTWVWDLDLRIKFSVGSSPCVVRWAPGVFGGRLSLFVDGVDVEDGSLLPPVFSAAILYPMFAALAVFNPFQWFGYCCMKQEEALIDIDARRKAASRAAFLKKMAGKLGETSDGSRASLLPQ